MQFIDRNFRLACIDAIHCAGHLPNPFAEPTTQSVAARIASLDNLTITEEMAGEIKDFSPDGGDDIYLFADPEWGAENEDLYISRFDDLVLLPNLESLWVHAVTLEGALDLSLLLKCASLKKVSADTFYVKPSERNPEIISELEKRGIGIDIG